MLKKILAMLLAFVMMLSLTACGGNTPTEPDDDGNRQERVTEEPKKTEEPEKTAEPEEAEEPEETEEPAEEPTEEPEEVSADFRDVMDEYRKIHRQICEVHEEVRRRGSSPFHAFRIHRADDPIYGICRNNGCL